MIWSNSEFTNLLKTVVPEDAQRNFNLVNAASLDVRFGNEIKIERAPIPEFDATGIADPLQRPSAFGETITLQPHEVYWLDPGEVILVSMHEEIHVPNDCGALFLLKSSRAREGYQHAMAGWVDPGWKGILTLEIRNWLRHNPIPVYEHLRIGQLVFFQLVSTTSRPYGTTNESGRYQNAVGVEASKPRSYDVR